MAWIGWKQTCLVAVALLFAAARVCSSAGAMSCMEVPSDPESEHDTVAVVLPASGCCQFDCCCQVNGQRNVQMRLNEIKTALSQETDMVRRAEYQYELLRQWAGMANSALLEPDFQMKPGKHRRFQVFGIMVCREAVAKFLQMSPKKVTTLCQWALEGHTKPPLDLRRSGVKAVNKTQDAAVTSAFQMWSWVPW